MTTGSRRGLAGFLVAALVLTALGSGIGTAQQSTTYVVEQGDACVEVTPLAGGNTSVEEFYGYSVDGSGDAVQYSANTPLGLETVNDQASSLFLYDGPDGLSLVLLHGATNGTAGGVATFEFRNLPADSEWAVQDDPANASVEQWNATNATAASVDWGWRGAYTDGGALRGGFDEEFAVSIDPAFNDAAAAERLEPGNVTQWRALSAIDQGLRAVALDLNRSVTVRTGTCAGS